MAVKKKSAAAPKAAAAPPAAAPQAKPTPVGGSLHFQAALQGMIEHPNQNSIGANARAIIFLFLTKRINQEEREALESFLVAKYYMIPQRVIDLVNRYEQDYNEDVAKYEAEKKKAAEGN